MQVPRRSAAIAQEKYKENPDEFWLDPKEWTNIKWHERSIYNIYDFPTYDIDINGWSESFALILFFLYLNVGALQQVNCFF